MKFVYVYFVVALALLSWPVIQLTNRVEPLIWGVPFFIFYCYAVALVVLLGNIFIGLKVIRDPAELDESQEESL